MKIKVPFMNNLSSAQDRGQSWFEIGRGQKRFFYATAAKNSVNAEVM